MRVRWTQAALGDFQTISRRVEQERNLAFSNRVCRAIYDQIQVLRRHPLSGRPGSKPGTRELILAKLPYIVAYRYLESDAVEILRIWHGAQDWRAEI